MGKDEKANNIFLAWMYLLKSDFQHVSKRYVTKREDNTYVFTSFINL